MHLQVLRDGAEIDVEYEVTLAVLVITRMYYLCVGLMAGPWRAWRVRAQVRPQVPLVPVLDGVDCVPSYFIVGGLVTLPLSVPFLCHAFGCAPLPPTTAPKHPPSLRAMAGRREQCTHAHLHALHCCKTPSYTGFSEVESFVTRSVA